MSGKKFSRKKGAGSSLRKGSGVYLNQGLEEEEEVGGTVRKSRERHVLRFEYLTKKRKGGGRKSCGGERERGMGQSLLPRGGQEGKLWGPREGKRHLAEMAIVKTSRRAPHQRVRDKFRLKQGGGKNSLLSNGGTKTGKGEIREGANAELSSTLKLLLDLRG